MQKRDLLKACAAVPFALALSPLTALAAQHYSASDGYAYKVVRHGVMISASMLPGKDGENINGPTVVKAPEWLKGAPGKYLMYFAHHTGEYIRLAYADKPTGPWKIYEGGVLSIKQLKGDGFKFITSHVASPEIYFDEKAKKVRMYFHMPITPAPKFDDPDYHRKVLLEKQETFLALSDDGLHFKVRTLKMGDHYMRVWPDGNGGLWGFSRLGQLNHSYNGFWKFSRLSPGPFERRPVTFAQIRHLCLVPQKDGQLVFYSKIGDTPESILVSKVTTNGEDWTKWTASEPKLVLTPETDYEGANLPLVPGKLGSDAKETRGLRDPSVLIDNGRMYLYYTVKGEKGIACAELLEK